MSENNIESLSPLEFTRLKPSVYCGNTDTPLQLVVELVSNAIDEHNIGNGDVINVEVNKDTSIVVEDEGQGFPINEMREDGYTVLQAAFCVMNTSGKYREDGSYEGVSLGANGMGGKISVFLSHKAKVESWRNGQKETDYFIEGELKNFEVNKSSEKSKSGTRITIYPSEEFFTKNKPNYDDLSHFFNEVTALCNSLKINFSYDGKKETFYHPEGLKALIDQNLHGSQPITKELYFEECNDKQELKVALTYSADSKITIIPYVNYGLTDSGPHITAIKSCITKILNKWAKEQKILSEKDKNLSGAELQEGLILVFNLVSPNIRYDAQVKYRIVNNDFVPFINKTFGETFEYWLDSNPEDGKIIVERAILAKKAAEAAKKARERVKENQGKKAQKNIVLPTSLTDCWTKDRSKAELFVCEGLSAGSGLIAARDSETQAIYAVRGKMLSVLKTKAENIYKNKEINNLITALGLSVNPKTAKCTYDPAKLRYDKIIAAADADSDGSAIENLLFNILWYICPELIINGHVYSAVPPLFRVTTKNGEYVYLRDESALEEYQQSHPGKQVVNRMKGLGEQDAQELSQCLLDNKTRNVVQLIVTNEEETNKMFSDLYGRRVEPRVTFLNEHSNDVTIDME